MSFHINLGNLLQKLVVMNDRYDSIESIFLETFDKQPFFHVIPAQAGIQN